MLEDLGFGSFNVGGTIDTVFFTIQIIILVLAAGAGLYYFMFTKQFKHKFRLKEVTNGRKIIIDDKAREFKDADGVTWWQLYKLKTKFSTPPPEAIEIDSKGRKCVEAYRTENGEIIFALDRAKILDVPDKLLNTKDLKKRAELITQWREDNRTIDAYQPYTTKQRLILISEHKKALSKKTKKWQDYILPVVGISALTIIVVSLMLFYGDMAKPLLDMGDKYNANQKILTEQLQILKEIKNDIQTLDDEKVITNKGAAPD